MQVARVTRRSVVGLLGAIACGCAGGGVPPPLRLGGAGEDPSADGKMIARYARRELDPATMASEQDRILRFQRAEAFFGLVYAPQLHRYLESVMRRVLARAPVPQLPARPVLVISRDWTANSTPPGLVFIPMGLVENLADEDQLAFVFAHELSHVLFRHHDSDWLVRSQKHAIAAGELVLAARSATGSRAEQAGPLSPAGMLAAQAVLAASDKIIAPAWNRNQEHQADLLGIDLMIAAGYNPGAAVEVLEKMVQWRKAAGRAYVDAPREPAREASDGSDGRGGRSQGRGRSDAQPDFQQLWRTLSAAIQRSLEGLSRPHPEPEQRLELVQQYLFREYRDLPPRDASVRPWEDARGQPQTREVFTRYARAFEARAKLREPDIREAERRALEAVQGFTRSHNFPRYTLAEVYARSNRRDQVVENLRAALDAPEPALETDLRLAELQERSGQPREALATLEAARAKFADHPRAWPDLIRLYRRAGRTQEASQLQLRCQIEFPDFRQLCAGTARG